MQPLYIPKKSPNPIWDGMCSARDSIKAKHVAAVKCAALRWQEHSTTLRDSGIALGIYTNTRFVSHRMHSRASWDIIRRAGVLQSASEGARNYLLSDVCANTRDRGCCVPWCQVESNLLEAHPECIDKTNSGNARAT